MPTEDRSSTSRLISEYFGRIAGLIASIDGDAVERIVEKLRSARDSGASIYVIGNGGSAATASHYATDLGRATKKGGLTPLRVNSLTDNVAWLSAVGNDESFADVFADQLENLIRAGDLLIAISASGNSQNLVRAVELAKKRDATTIAVVGFDGGRLLNMADLAVHVPSHPGDYGPTEDIHMAIGHVITECLKVS